LEVTASVKVEVDVNPATVNFRELSPTEKKSESIEVANLSSDSFKINSITTPHDFISVDLSGHKLPVTLKPNEKMSFKVGVNAALMKEKTWGQVIIATSNAHTPEVTLYLTGRVRIENQTPKAAQDSPQTPLPQITYSEQAQKLFPLYNFVFNNVSQNLTGCNTGQCLPMKAFIQLLVDQKVPEGKITEAIKQIYGQAAVVASAASIEKAKPRLSLRESIQNELKESDKKAKLDLFVMSYCPFGVRAETALVPILAEFGPKIDLQLYFIAQSKANDSPAANTASVSAGSASVNKPLDSFASLHGPQEVEEDFRQALIQKHFPEKLLPYLSIRNQNIRTSDWKECATKAGIDLKKMEGLIADKNSQQLFKENITKGQLLNVHASPTLFINNVRYQGGFH